MSSTAADLPGAVPGRVVEVAERIYAYIQNDGSWWINNAGFLVADDGVTSIDTCSTEERTRAYRRSIESTTELPVRTLLNTHHHGDHTFGNSLFTNATIIAHEGVRIGMRAWGPPRSQPYWTDVDWGDVHLQVPFVTYDDRVTLWIDDMRCEVRYVGGAAHTTNDSIVWIPEHRVLFSGDLLFNGGTPFVVQGSVAGSIRVLDQVIAPLDPQTIVPGHGNVCGPEVIEDVVGYLRFIQDVAEEAHRAGLTPLEAALEADLGPYGDLGEKERIVGNLHRAYAEIEGGSPGESIDASAALADMVTYNGGQPLACLA